MNLYSHAILAQALQGAVAPDDPAAYLWGAVVPDIRYLAGLRRETTHLPDETIRSWFAQYPGHEAFIQGYRVHCLIDTIATVPALTGAFPLRWLQRFRRREFSSQMAAVVIELYYQTRRPRGPELVGGHNPILASLGITPEQSATFAFETAGYLRSPSYQSVMTTFAHLGIIDDARIEKYTRAYRNLRRNPILLGILMASARNARLSEKALRLWKEK